MLYQLILKKNGKINNVIYQHKSKVECISHFVFYFEKQLNKTYKDNNDNEYSYHVIKKGITNV